MDKNLIDENLINENLMVGSDSGLERAVSSVFLTSGERIGDIVIENQVPNLASSVTVYSDNKFETEVDSIDPRSPVVVGNNSDRAAENVI